MVAKYFLLKGLFGVLGLVFVFFVVFFFLASCRASRRLGVDQLCSKRADHSQLFLLATSGISGGPAAARFASPRTKLAK